MNVKTIILFVTGCFLSTAVVSGQEPTGEDLGSAIKRASDTRPSLLEQSIIELQKSVRWAEIRLASQRLKKSSTRNLKFPVGRYWVDDYSKLINLNDNEVGIWGVDYSQRNSPPMFHRR